MTQPHDSVKSEISPRAILRKELLNNRRNSAVIERQEWDKHISLMLLDLLQRHPPACLGVFWPIKAEPNLQNLYQKIHDTKIPMALPQVIGKNQALAFLPWMPDDLMIADSFGIPTPANRERVVQPDMLLIPCVGFNAKYFRLGYGAGFYDRTLAIKPRPIAIGVAYELSRTHFESHIFDIAMDFIVTELTTKILL